MRTSSMVAAAVCLANAIPAIAQSDRAADPRFAGTWKLNLAKSDFGETTVTYTGTTSGRMQLTASGQSYTFQIDGQAYPSLFGGTATWSEIDGATWRTVIKQDGKLISTVTSRLSADGQALTTHETGPKQTGGTFERTTRYSRAAGGPGLAGVWKTKNAPRWPRLVELVPSGSEGLAIGFPDDREVCEAKFDGKDYPMTGPVAQPGMTLALQKTGVRSFDVTGKQAGKPILKASFSVSDDGNTLTQAVEMVGAAERVMAVYDRQ
jgi:hypothetical protein